MSKLASTIALLACTTALLASITPYQHAPTPPGIHHPLAKAVPHPRPHMCPFGSIAPLLLRAPAPLPVCTTVCPHHAPPTPPSACAWSAQCSRHRGMAWHGRFIRFVHSSRLTCFSTVPSELSCPLGRRAKGERATLAADSCNGWGSWASTPAAACMASRTVHARGDAIWWQGGWHVRVLMRFDLT